MRGGLLRLAPALLATGSAVPAEQALPRYIRNRVALTEGLGKLGYEYIEPQGAFYLWVKALEPDASAFFEKCFGKSFSEQINNVCDYISSKAEEAVVC